MKKLAAALATRDPRLVWGGMLLLVALVAFECWHLVLRPSVVQYAQVRDSRAALEAIVAASPPNSGELERLTAEVQGLVQKLDGELRMPQSDEQLTAFLVRELDRSAQASGATLNGVKPAMRRSVAGFDETAFDVTAEGKYLTLCAWLMELESALGASAGVTEFSMKTADSRRVAVTFKLAVYRRRTMEQAK